MQTEISMMTGFPLLCFGHERMREQEREARMNKSEKNANEGEGVLNFFSC